MLSILFQGIPPDLTQLHWTLKPLFFEVPTAEANPVFVGRQWLFREVMENLSSDLPTNGGVVVSGGPGSGKSAVILQMVEHSCFGRAGENRAADNDINGGVESIYNQSQLSLALSSTSAHFVNHNSSSNRSLNDLASKVNKTFGKF